MITTKLMAALIQKFAVGDEVTLHVDLTGGMCDVNIMMLDLTRLLEYSGLKIGRLLYSNLGKKTVEKNFWARWKILPRR